MLRVILFLVTFILLGNRIHASDNGGEFVLKYANIKEKGYYYNLYEGFINFSDISVYKNYFLFNLDGKFGYKDYMLDDKKDIDIYAFNLNFLTFQKRFDLKLGRFSNINNRFMMIDGIDLNVLTDYFFGFNVFGGIPKYIRREDNFINEEFRDTGDRIYGFKIFSNGTDVFNASAGYSKETDDSHIVQEILSFGGGVKYKFSDDLEFKLDGFVDYEIHFDDIYRAEVKANFKLYKLKTLLSATKFNVKDGYASERKLVISNFSTGKEERYAYYFEYPIIDYIKIYHSLTHTYVQYKSLEWVEGNIIDVGFVMSMLEKLGFTFDVDMYKYESRLSDASGVKLSFDWYITNKLKANLQTEYIDFKKWDYSKNIYSLFCDLNYKFAKNKNVSLFAEKNSNVIYLPEKKIGAKFQWEF